MNRFQIREFEFDKDYEPVLKLWQSIETGINIGRSDTPEEIQKKIQRDPDLFLLAEADRKVIGSVIGGFDGRRGMVYHLAVHDQYRKQGIGSALLAEVEKRLKTKGCLKMYLLVLANNSSVLKFYEECGWRHAVEDLIFMKEL